MMKIPFSKEEIKKLCDASYQIMEKSSGEILGDIKEDEREITNNDFEENVVWSGNCFDGFFEQINVCRFGEKLFVELQKLGDYDGYYKDWAMKKYMQTLADICDNMDDIWVSNYEYEEDDPMFRAFFVAFVFDINEYEFYEEVYKYCHDFCNQLETLVERKISGHFWDEKFETDEMLFCTMYLTPFFKRMGFKQVIFNHGNKEFGKDYILVSQNIFGETEYYGVQAKAGNMSGSATSNISEISNQINLGFSVPYKLIDGTEVYISKMIVAISGNFTDNAKKVIEKMIERYKATNTIYLSKKELENHYIMR